MLLEILLVLLSWLLTRILWKRWKYDLHRIPSQPGLPFFGHTLNILANRGENSYHRYLVKSWKALQEPSLFKLSLGGETNIFLHDLETAKLVMASRTIPVKKSEFFMRFLEPLIANDITAKKLLAEAENTPYAKDVRRVYASGLQSQRMRVVLPQLHAVLDKAIEIIDVRRQKGPLDFEELCVRLSLDAIGVIAFGTCLGGLDDSRPTYKLVVDVGHICAERSFNLLQSILYKLLPSLEGARKQQSTIDALTAEWKSLTDEILKRSDPPAGEMPIWHNLRTFVDPETGKKLEYKSLVAEIASVVIAGMDTTGHQLSCILALVASSPSVAEKVVAELKEHGLFGPGCRNITLDDLSELVYLSAVVKEGIRVSHVSESGLERELCSDATILGYRLPKGVSIVPIGQRWTNSKAEWDDPDAFKPERWLTGEDMSQKYYIPFGCGARDCPGQKLAILEMRIAIARIVQRYHLTSVRPAEEVLLNCRSGLVTETIDGIWLHAEPRF